VRSRAQTVRVFLTWCTENDTPTGFDPSILASRRSPLRQYPPTYGKVQAARPARWLDREDAFGPLLEACRDDGIIGMRDEIVLRLGLLGMRATEIGTLPLRALQLDATPPAIAWTGKGNKPRRVVPGSALVSLLRDYTAAYAANVVVAPDAPLVCRLARGHRRNGRRVAWGVPFNVPRQSIYVIVSSRASAAGLGHVAPHDLRRSCAGILHRTTNDDGAHHFDLLDIQKHLGHSDPATTMRSYLDPMDTGVIERAAKVLD
jgi:integrase